jgi:hypothetical protein
MGRGREAKATVLIKVPAVPAVTPVMPVVMMPVPAMMPMTMVPVAMVPMMPAPMVAVMPPMIAHLDDTGVKLPGQSNGRAEVGSRRGLRAPHEQPEA